MRILIVGLYFWPESFRINDVAESLQRAGCTVTALTGPPNYPEGKVFSSYSALALRSERWKDVLIHRVPLVPRGRGTALRLALNYLSFVVSASCLGPWLLRKQNFDAILVYAAGPILVSLPAMLFAAIKRASVVTWVQDLWPESLEATGFVRNKKLLAFVACVVRWIYRHNDLLLVQSESFVDGVRAMAGHTPVVYHPNPGDVRGDDAVVRVDSALLLNAGFNVVFAGNFGTVQALDTILDAAERTRQHTDVWWVLIGSGRRSEWLANEVERRKLTQVVLPGRFAPEAMPSIYAQASALLVSLVHSPIMSQTVPSKVQSYLAAGRPIVAAIDGEGARVVAEAGAGLTCPAEDAAALSAAVLRLKELPAATLERFGRAGRAYYRQHFDPDVLAGRLIDCLRGTTSRDGKQLA
jgi:glycosyltransferase involved in cell wall biosynthesis